jgi:hypothetical protein
LLDGGQQARHNPYGQSRWLLRYVVSSSISSHQVLIDRSDEARMELQNALTKHEDELKTYINNKNEFEKGGKKDTRGKLSGIRAKIVTFQEKVDLLTWTIEVYDIVHYPVKQEMSNAEKRELADPVWEKIKVKFVSDDLKEPPLNLPKKWKILRTELEYDVVAIPSIGSSYATGSAT